MPEQNDAFKKDSARSTGKEPQLIATEPTEMNPNDTALLAAWRRLMDYDRVSSGQKGLYQYIRQWVIVITLLTSTLAVLSTFFRIDPVLDVLKEPVRWLLVILPVAAVAFMNYAGEFATSTAWIEYRVSAEMIRSEIYRYRMRAGKYMGKSLFERQQLLLDMVERADDRIEEQESAASLPYLQVTTDKILEEIKGKVYAPASANEDGLRPLSIREYVDFRVREQLNWYINKVQNDYSIRKVERRNALIIASIGSVLSGVALNLEPLVAITTALAVSLTTYADMRMYGATYGIYHRTAAKLQMALNNWSIQTEAYRKDENAISKFVDMVEDIFGEERESWRVQAIQTLQTNDQSILSGLQRGEEGSDGEVSRTTIIAGSGGSAEAAPLGRTGSEG